MRTLIMVLFFAFAVIGIILIVPKSGTELAAAPAIAVPTAFSGTIDYYPNNLGTSIPYLVYQDQGVSTRALLFTGSSVCVTAHGTYPCTLIADALAAYYGGTAVSVTGALDAENLVVVRLTPA